MNNFQYILASTGFKTNSHYIFTVEILKNLIVFLTSTIILLSYLYRPTNTPNEKRTIGKENRFTFSCFIFDD